MTRYEWLVQESRRLDDLHDSIVRGETVAPIVLKPAMIEDGLGGFMILAPVPRETRKRSRPRTNGPLARAVRSDAAHIFQNCTHCHPAR